MSLAEVFKKSGRTPRKRALDNDNARICWMIEAAAAAAFSVSVDELRAPSRRGPAVAFARQSAMYLAHVVVGLRYSEIGRLFGRDRTTAAYACRLVEDRRDDPAVDRLLHTLEDLSADLACGIRSRPQVRP
jgi:chromosomal replication initiation ATPase DnaA